jgi:cytochrome c biogenesis protein
MAVKVSLARRIVQTMAAVRTGIILLIILGLVAAAGTLILQRPITSPEEMQRAYSPQVLQWLDRLGLTNVFHTWWFAILLGLVSLSIILASIERFPNAWRFFARPYRRPDSHFRAVLPLRKEIRIRAAAAAVDAAERAFRKHGLKPERVVEHDQASLYAERARFSVLGAYVVHVALLLIAGGYIVDSMVGYRGYIQLARGQQSDQIREGAGVRTLPFTLRCDGAGQENYPDGTPKRWWSNLTVLENGRESRHKQIIVNDPLVYRGIRFYQSSYGMSGELQGLKVEVVNRGDTQPSKVLDLALNVPASVDDKTALKLVRFISDAYPMDGDLYQRSRDLDNAAAQLEITTAGQTQAVWLFRAEQSERDAVTLVGPYDVQGAQVATPPYQFVASAEMAPYTGLQVSYEPGQWGIWAGTIVLAIGLCMAFYFLHMRFWALPITDDKGGLVLWVGAAASKNKEVAAERFRELTAEIEQELNEGNPSQSRAVASGD